VHFASALFVQQVNVNEVLRATQG